MKTYRNKPALAYNSHENMVIDGVPAFHVMHVFERFCVDFVLCFGVCVVDGLCGLSALDWIELCVNRKS